MHKDCHFNIFNQPLFGFAITCLSDNCKESGLTFIFPFLAFGLSGSYSQA